MKAQLSIRSISALLTLVWVVLFNTCSAQQLQPTSNWLNAWKSFAGNQVSAQWIHEQVAEGAQVFCNKETLVLHTSTAWNSMEEMQNGLEEGIQEGGSNNMMQSSDARILDNRSAITTWNGTLGGRPMYAVVAAQLGMDGNAQLVISLSHNPIQPSVELEKHEIVAFLRSMDGNTNQHLARNNN